MTPDTALTTEGVRPTPRAPAEASAEPLIRFDGVTLELSGHQLYRDLSFTVAPGEFVCILGPSGCGKSTALRLLGGLLAATAGRITIDGETPEAAWQRMAFVFQSPRLAAWRSALDNVLLARQLRFGEKPDAAARKRAADLLDLVGLSHDTAKYPRMLSGGERQRVSIARALAVDPDIVLMDEPFSALDPTTRQRLRAEIIAIWQKTSKTVLFVTHDVDEAVALADRILLLSNKPTVVREIVRIDAPRPRLIDHDAELRGLRDHLLRSFAQMESGNQH
ncbi:MAG: ABC transporter ATP-binding protein [Alphaproteobacteria bacterium]|nr:ABC transporter ATP-binding protein [Alphaproteobacteria bacterium]